jgi:hypothetical protein
MHVLSSLLGLGGLLDNYEEFMCKKNQQDAHFFSLTILFNYIIFDMFLKTKCSLSGRLYSSFTVSKTYCQTLDCLYRRMIKYHKTARTSLPDDEYLVVRNMSKVFNVLFPVHLA